MCGKKIDWQSGQTAHRIPKTKGNIKQYGLKIIDSPLNLKTTCSLRCNSAVLIENSPIEKEQLIEAIKRRGRLSDGRIGSNPKRENYKLS